MIKQILFLLAIMIAIAIIASAQSRPTGAPTQGEANLWDWLDGRLDTLDARPIGISNALEGMQHPAVPPEVNPETVRIDERKRVCVDVVEFACSITNEHYFFRGSSNDPDDHIARFLEDLGRTISCPRDVRLRC